MRRIAIRILAADYEYFRRLLAGDERLPEKYDDWARRASEEVARLTRRGQSFVPVVIKPDELLAYCGSIGQEPSYTILEALAVKKAYE